MSRRLLTIATVVVIVAAFVGLVLAEHHANHPSASSEPAPLSAPRVGDRVPRLHLITVDRRSIAVPGTGWGAIAFVDGLNCRPCLRSATALRRAAQAAHAPVPVLVDANASDGRAEVAALRHATGWHSDPLVLDTPDNGVAAKFDVETIGTILIWRPGGTLADVLVTPSAATLARALRPAGTA
jgi:hypothetical protein